LPPDREALLHANLGAIFQEALSSKWFSGASLLVAGPEEIALQAAYGRVSHEEGSAPVDAASWFDLASLTKPLVTATLTMVAVAGGKLALDEPLSAALPGTRMPADKQNIRVRHLLNHCSGLPAYQPYYRRLMATAQPLKAGALLSWILREPLLAPPGTRCEYSDLGLMLVGEILVRRLGMPLNRAASYYLFDPLKIDTLGYRPLQIGADPSQQPLHEYDRRGITFVKTQFCPWRKRLLDGEVDDENAYSLGGVAAHAGLFGTARGIYTLLEFLWRGHRESVATASWAAAMVPMFWKRQELIAESTWALGFDTPSPAHSSCGDHFSKDSVGHLGFTGTSFWLDLNREVLVILLTNRVHPTRENSGIKTFRPVIHNLVMEILNAPNRC
jgi:serine-type D-Ala-D-Ala carboxypeptidase